MMNDHIIESVVLKIGGILAIRTTIGKKKKKDVGKGLLFCVAVRRRT